MPWERGQIQWKVTSTNLPSSKPVLSRTSPNSHPCTSNLPLGVGLCWVVMWSRAPCPYLPTYPQPGLGDRNARRRFFDMLSACSFGAAAKHRLWWLEGTEGLREPLMTAMSGSGRNWPCSEMWAAKFDFCLGGAHWCLAKSLCNRDVSGQVDLAGRTIWQDMMSGHCTLSTNWEQPCYENGICGITAKWERLSDAHWPYGGEEAQFRNPECETGAHHRLKSTKTMSQDNWSEEDMIGPSGEGREGAWAEGELRERWVSGGWVAPEQERRRFTNRDGTPAKRILLLARI